MFLGRPVNLWTGLIGAAVGTLGTVIGATQTPEVAQTWIIILGAVGAFLGVLIAFLAGQQPVMNPGDPYQLRTPSGSPNLSMAAPTMEAVQASPVPVPPVATVPDPTTSTPAQDVQIDGQP